MDILRRRVTCYRRELERQVCEVNFDFVKAAPEERVEPHHFSEAIKALVEAKQIDEHIVELGSTPYRFWSLAGLDETTVQAVLAAKVQALLVFIKGQPTPELSVRHPAVVRHTA